MQPALKAIDKELCNQWSGVMITTWRFSRMFLVNFSCLGNPLKVCVPDIPNHHVFAKCQLETCACNSCIVVQDAQYKAVIVFCEPKSASSALEKQTQASRHIPNYILKNKQTGACKHQHLAAGSHASPPGKWRYWLGILRSLWKRDKGSFFCFGVRRWTTQDLWTMRGVDTPKCW